MLLWQEAPKCPVHLRVCREVIACVLPFRHSKVTSRVVQRGLLNDRTGHVPWHCPCDPSFYRHIECKSIMGLWTPPPRFQRKGWVGDQVMWDSIGFPAGELKRAMHEAVGGWSCNGDSRKLESHKQWAKSAQERDMGCKQKATEASLPIHSGMYTRPGC